MQNGFPTNNIYRADGVKVHKNFTINGETIDTDYIDGFVYISKYTLKIAKALSADDQLTRAVITAGQEETFELAQRIIDGGNPPAMQQSTPSFFPTAEGFYDFENFKYIYQYKDHLGNVRRGYSYNSSEDALAIEDTNNYYPFGLSFILQNSLGGSQYSPSTTYKNYKYNGKELQETGMYEYGARMYMPDIGRWGVVDPLAELQSRHSPYTYTFNNPIYFNDPTGMIGEPCDTCPKEIDPNKPGGANNPDLIQEVVITGYKAVNFVMNGLQGGYDSAKDMLTFAGERQLIKDSYNSVHSLVNPNAPSLRTKGRNPNLLCITGDCPEFELEDMDPYIAELMAMYKDAKNGNGYRTGYNIVALLALIITHKGKTVRNGSLAGGVHPKTGVPFKSNGFPDFSEHLYKGGANDVMIKPTGNRALDRSAANKAAGYNRTPKDYIWHHNDTTGRMQLIDAKVHSKTAHTGGFSIWY